MIKNFFFHLMYYQRIDSVRQMIYNNKCVNDNGEHLIESGSAQFWLGSPVHMQTLLIVIRNQGSRFRGGIRPAQLGKVVSW